MTADPVTLKTDGQGQPSDTRTVRECLEGRLPIELTEELRADLHKRLDYGEGKYGTKLMEGWHEARMQLYQEMLDGVLYAISCGDADAICGALWLAKYTRKKITTRMVVQPNPGALSPDRLT